MKNIYWALIIICCALVLYVAVSIITFNQKWNDNIQEAYDQVMLQNFLIQQDKLKTFETKGEK